jgi:hypothetical protein
MHAIQVTAWVYDSVGRLIGEVSEPVIVEWAAFDPQMYSSIGFEATFIEDK